jgi:hypothetical protein
MNIVPEKKFKLYPTDLSMAVLDSDKSWTVVLRTFSTILFLGSVPKSSRKLIPPKVRSSL